MKFVTHNEDPFIDADGTHLQGYIAAHFDEMVYIFGDPDLEGSDKVDCEWTLRFEDGTVATIYNWENIGNFDTNTEWHVGGHSGRALTLVREEMEYARDVYRGNNQ